MTLEKTGKYYKDTIAMAETFCRLSRADVHMLRSRARSLVKYATEENYDEYNGLFAVLDNLLYDIDVLMEGLSDME